MSKSKALSEKIEFEPLDDEALLDFASLDDGNSERKFKEYVPSIAICNQWAKEIHDILG